MSIYVSRLTHPLGTIPGKPQPVHESTRPQRQAASAALRTLVTLHRRGVTDVSPHAGLLAWLLGLLTRHVIADADRPGDEGFAECDESPRPVWSFDRENARIVPCGRDIDDSRN